MISFANPLWLYGLSGVLIPIGIHLLSRKQGKTIYIGSLRHLSDSDSAQFSSIRLNEVLLLILRILLIVLIVFILAGFNFKNKRNEPKQWLVLEKGVEKNKNYSSVIDSLIAKGFETHWFAKGFPLLEDSAAITNSENYFALLYDLPNSIDTAVVMSYAFAERFKGEKMSLSERVHWLSIDPEDSEGAIDAIRLGSDSVSIRIIKSTSKGTALRSENLQKIEYRSSLNIDTVTARNPDTIKIAVYATPKFAYDAKVVHATLLAIAKATPHKLQITAVNSAAKVPSESDFVFWLSDEQLPITNKIIFGYAACENKNMPLITAWQEAAEFCSTSGFDWVITQRLNEENALEESFSYSLSKIILPKNRNARALSYDHRTLPENAAFSKLKSKEQKRKTVGQSIAGSEPLLAVLLFILLIAERFIAYKRNQ